MITNNFNSFYIIRFTPNTNKWFYSSLDVNFIDIFLAHNPTTYIIKQRMPANKFLSNILGKKRL